MCQIFSEKKKKNATLTIKEAMLQDFLQLKYYNLDYWKNFLSSEKILQTFQLKTAVSIAT